MLIYTLLFIFYFHLLKSLFLIFIVALSFCLVLHKACNSAKDAFFQLVLLGFQPSHIGDVVV